MDASIHCPDSYSGRFLFRKIPIQEWRSCLPAAGSSVRRWPFTLSLGGLPPVRKTAWSSEDHTTSQGQPALNAPLPLIWDSSRRLLPVQSSMWVGWCFHWVCTMSHLLPLLILPLPSWSQEHSLINSFLGTWPIAAVKLGLLPDEIVCVRSLGSPVNKETSVIQSSRFY